MSEQRFTLTLPETLYNELRNQADQHSTSIKEVVRQALKFGLVAIKLGDDPNVEIYIKEKVPSTDDGNIEIKETRLVFIW